jgi:alkylated DNA repair dioxygenase AlkB
LFVPNLYDANEFVDDVPTERGQFSFYGKKENEFSFVPVEHQVNGSVARYWHPKYKEAHSKIRLKLEQIIGSKLYNTYYYDRFYFPGQELIKHTDRESCEISVTIHIDSNLKNSDWPIWIKTPDVYKDKTKKEILEKGKDVSCLLKPGDGMIYKGCERPHWREPLQGPAEEPGQETFYYHQIFFHYVLQDGIRCQHAFDRGVVMGV